MSINDIFSEEAESLDDKGLVNQYVHPVSGGYYLGFENGSRNTYQMKLVLNGLFELSEPFLTSVDVIVIVYTLSSTTVF